MFCAIPDAVPSPLSLELLDFKLMAEIGSSPKTNLPYATSPPLSLLIRL
ncbi:hypothetical protein CEV34_2523 [Brucella pseudogrignonensis]|uniref:Uncharacterized protein n=1 Tax=Brucella pseudogrignonensis TaxID=419475 RepID=A0A256GFC8_9HYPH|nr:hypothetical protein CEV34_2523 [Brucella pseudogrignonensis]